MKTLVSLCITSYNQSCFIESALKSAFEQTYTPLEIVVLDDCSTDDTYEKILKLVNSYRRNTKGTGHEVVVARNERNLGVARNYDKCFRMAHGELLVTGSGDDLSAPNRCERLVETWLSLGRKPMSLIHNGFLVNVKGTRVGVIGRRGADFPLGAATAYNRKLFEFAFTFPDGVYEDHMFSPVAAVLGGVVFLDEMLMEYRVGSGLSSRGVRRSRIKTAIAGVNGQQQSIRDIQSLRASIDPSLYREWVRLLSNSLDDSKSALKLYGGETWKDRWQGFCKLRRKRLLCTYNIQLFMFLFPPVFGDVIPICYFGLCGIIRSCRSRMLNEAKTRR